MSKKTAIAAAVVIVVGGGIAAAPYITKPHVAEAIQNPQLSADIVSGLAARGLQLDVSSASYKEDGLTAQSVTRLKLHSVHEDANDGLCLDVKSDIDYGYGTLFSGHLASLDSQLAEDSDDEQCRIVTNKALAKPSNKELKKVVDSLFADGAPVTAQTALPWFGGYDTTFNVAGRTIKDPSKPEDVAGELEFRPLTVHVASNGDDQVQTDYSWGGMHLISKGPQSDSSEVAEVTIGKIEGQSDSTRYKDSDYLWMGDASFNAELMDFSLKSKYRPIHFSVGKMALQAKNDASGGKIDSKVDLKLNSFALNDMPLGDFALNLATNNIDAEGFENLMQKVQESVDDPSYGDDREVVKLFPAVLSGAEVKLSPVALSNGEQKLSLDGTVNIDNVADEAASMGPQGLMLALAGATNAKANVVIDKELLKQGVQAFASVEATPLYGPSADELAQRAMSKYTMQLDMMTKQGLLKYDEDKQRYTSEVSFGGGKVTINGKEKSMMP